MPKGVFSTVYLLKITGAASFFGAVPALMVEMILRNPKGCGFATRRVAVSLSIGLRFRSHAAVRIPYFIVSAEAAHYR